MTDNRAIDTYLAEVAAGLAGPRRPRASILAELRSGLLDALDAHRCSGLPSSRAVQAAINEFGSPQEVAASFRPELTIRQVRRAVISLVATAVPIVLIWAHAARSSDLGTRRGASLWHFFGTPPVPLAVAAFLIAVVLGLATVAMTGRLTRWLPCHPRSAATTAAIGGFGAAAADLAIFVLLAGQLIGLDPGGLAPVPVTVAAIASFTRLTLAGRGARDCLAAGAALA